MKENRKPRVHLFEVASRVPPGQFVTEKFPVFTYGSSPQIDLKEWEFEIFGLVEETLRFTYEQLMQLPKVKVVADFHCVTQWSRLNGEWEGIPFKEALKLIRPKPEANYGMVHCYGGYTTNLPLEALEADNVLFAHKLDGRDLVPEHGWPLRLVVPNRYGWKSAKWVRGLELMVSDRPGFWESRGYHMEGDPWLEQRFGD